MSLELHCPQCQKLIRAPDGAGGKRGKCPYCKNTIYIPTPPDEREEIGLAPVDEEEERRAEKLRRESIQYAAAVAHVKDVGPEGAVREAGDTVDITAEVETFVLAMHASKLDVADAAAARLERAGVQARDYVQWLMSDETSITFENIPPPLANGFLKTLLDRLG